MALFRDLEARVRADLGAAPSGVEVDDDALLFEIARRALGGPSDEGRASYQLAVTRCPECQRVSVDGGGESHEVDSAVAEMVACDCQEVGLVDGQPETTGDGESAECSRVGASMRSESSAAECPRVGAAGAPNADPPAPRARAKQSIPPAIRRGVMRRDRGHCVVPGCANHRWLDVHHVLPRAEGGRHDPDKMGILCGTHHRAVHAGRLVIDGAASTGFRFRHADGTSYGGPLSP
jgi:hypothetical protein